MRKVRLNPGDLRVATFQTLPARAAGTVRTHSGDPTGTGSAVPSDDPCATCADSCWGACVETQAWSCWGSCDRWCTLIVEEC